MSKPSLLRIIKRWRRYEPRDEWKYLLPITRGIYVLYRAEPSGAPPKGRPKIYTVTYIGVAGIAKQPKSGIGSRLRNHHKNRKNWTHYSFFEVHDNVSRYEILELEVLLLAIFRHDPRIQLENKQKGSARLNQLRKGKIWHDVSTTKRRAA